MMDATWATRRLEQRLARIHGRIPGPPMPATEQGGKQMFSLSDRSKAKLSGVHHDLVRVVELAMTMTREDFMVGEGIRTLERQLELVAAGKSQTMKSRHLTGHAVDLWCLDGGKVVWDMPRYRRLAEIVEKAARAVGVPVEWGGNWKSLRDGPHFQLPRDQYPD